MQYTFQADMHPLASAGSLFGNAARPQSGPADGRLAVAPIEIGSCS